MMRTTPLVTLVAVLAAAPATAQRAADAAAGDAIFAAPIRLHADGKPIQIGELSNIAHAGPWVADVDGDGDRDLLVGDFPGWFWYFENTSNDENPTYTAKGKLQAGGEAAKTPVY